MEPAEKEVEEALKLAPGEQVWSALKVFYADEHPCVISYDYVSTEIFRGGTGEAEVFSDP